MNRFTMSRRPHTRKLRAAVRLELEPLESRSLPSTIPPVNVNTDSGGDGGFFHDETTIAVNPTNPLNMIGSANDLEGFASNGGQIHLLGYNRAHVTFDGGQTWMEYPVPFQGYNTTFDPAVSFDADGTAYLSNLGLVSSQNLTGNGNAPDVVVSHSTDGGQTWSAQVRVAKGTGNNVPNGQSTLNDKEYIAAWGHGNALVTWTQYHFGPTGDFIDAPIYASVTHDGGNTWTDPVKISGTYVNAIDAVPTVAANGSIYIAFWSWDNEAAPDYRDHYIVAKVDPTTGEPAGSPVEVGLVYDGLYDYPSTSGSAFPGERTTRTLQDSQFKVYAQGNITADPTNAGHLAVIWADMRNNPYPGARLPSLDPYQVQTNSDVIVSQSFDAGQTWTSPIAIKLPGDQFQPWGAYNSSGLLQIGYYDRSYDPANHLYGYTLASEKKAGSLKFTTQQVTTILSDPTKNDYIALAVTANPNFPSATTFMGDYSGIAVVPGTNEVAALWTDMRVPTPIGWNEDAFFALVDPPGGGSGGAAPALISAVAAATQPGALLSSAASGAGLAVDAYFIDLARMSRTTTSSVTNGEPAKVPPTFASGGGLTRAMVTPRGHLLAAPADDLLESLFSGDKLFPADLAAI